VAEQLHQQVTGKSGGVFQFPDQITLLQRLPKTSRKDGSLHCLIKKEKHFFPFCVCLLKFVFSNHSNIHRPRPLRVWLPPRPIQGPERRFFFLGKKKKNKEKALPFQSKILEFTVIKVKTLLDVCHSMRNGG
jgi:hypothetical protein